MNINSFQRLLLTRVHLDELYIKYDDSGTRINILYLQMLLLTNVQIAGLVKNMTIVVLERSWIFSKPVANRRSSGRAT